MDSIYEDRCGYGYCNNKACDLHPIGKYKGKTLFLNVCKRHMLFLEKHGFYGIITTSKERLIRARKDSAQRSPTHEATPSTDVPDSISDGELQREVKQ